MHSRQQLLVLGDMGADCRSVGRYDGELAGPAQLGARVDDLGSRFAQLGSLSSGLGQPGIDLGDGILKLRDSTEAGKSGDQLSLS